jgi:hypothetical protein
LFAEGNIDCVKKLLKPANRVLRIGVPIKHEAFEHRVELWNRVRMNYENYLNEECGSFLKDLDQHFCSLFDGALLVLAASFQDNGEFFKAANVFSDAEVELLRNIERYNLFEILSAEDIKKKLIQKDDSILELLKDYYVSMDSWVDEQLEDPALRLTLRYYLKKKWDGYKEKLNFAVSSSVLELDWLKSLIVSWEHTTKTRVEAAEKKIEAEKVRNEEQVLKIKAQKENSDARLKIMEAEKARDEEQIKAIESEKNRAKEQIQALTAEKEQIEEKVRKFTAEKALAEGKGSRYVKIEEVKQYELNFIGRLENKLGDLVTFLGKPYKVEDLREIKQVDTSGFAASFGLSTLDLKNLPENRSLLGALTEKKLLGKKQHYQLKACFSARVEKYAEMGFDTDPLGLKDLNACLVNSRDEAKEKGECLLLCLASPTGFDDTIDTYLSSEDFHRNFLSKYLSVCLLDLETGKLLYNPHDEVAKELAKLCELETETEKNEKIKISVKKTLEEGFLLKDFIILEDVAKSFGRESAVKSAVKPAFYEYANEKGYAVKFLEEVGLVMMK